MAVVVQRDESAVLMGAQGEEQECTNCGKQGCFQYAWRPKSQRVTAEFTEYLASSPPFCSVSCYESYYYLPSN